MNRDNSKHRDRDFAPMLVSMGLTNEGAEIGVGNGANARTILKGWNGKVLWLIDVWERQPKEIYREKTDNVKYDRWFAECEAMVAKDQRARIVRKFSVDAAKQFDDQSLDFVYIDANHSLEAVSADISAWSPKVKKGGLLCGHDYGNDTNWPHYNQVSLAVDDYASKTKLPVTVWRCDSWFIRIP